MGRASGMTYRVSSLTSANGGSRTCSTTVGSSPATLSYVALTNSRMCKRSITLKQGDEFTTAAAYGIAREELVRLPLFYQHEQIGELLLAPRRRGETFSAADRGLLDDLARQAGVAAHAVRLTADLQHSRERLVTTREEERRRLRRDLHDGLGPTLAALNLDRKSTRL